jgi:hypothetical protein
MNVQFSALMAAQVMRNYPIKIPLTFDSLEVTIAIVAMATIGGTHWLSN